MILSVTDYNQRWANEMLGSGQGVFESFSPKTLTDISQV